MGEKLDLRLREYIREPVSTAELERRWAATRQAMALEGLDCLVMQNSNEYMGGYVRWFTDYPALQGYPTTIIFPACDEMTVIASGGRSAPSAVPMWVYRGVKERVTAPYFLSMNYTNTMDAEETVAQLKQRNAKRIGIVGKAYMSAVFFDYVREQLAGRELVDATDMVDGIKAIKSEEEIALIRRACAVQDAAWAVVPALARPGVREYEIRAELTRLLIGMGSEEQWVMVGSSSHEGKPRQRPKPLQNRTLGAGDQLTVMIEVSGPGGYYAELSRTICLADPMPELLAAWDISVEAQLYTAKLLKPGASPAEVARAHDDFMVSHGCSPERRLYAHGQGYDLVERPAIREDEPMVVAAGMNITIHPFAITEKGYGYACDNYLVTEAGTERLHKTPLEVFRA